jgi:hypothetical protein
VVIVVGKQRHDIGNAKKRRASRAKKTSLKKQELDAMVRSLIDRGLASEETLDHVWDWR